MAQFLEGLLAITSRDIESVEVEQYQEDQNEILIGQGMICPECLSWSLHEHKRLMLCALCGIMVRYSDYKVWYKKKLPDTYKQLIDDVNDVTKVVTIQSVEEEIRKKEEKMDVEGD